MSSESGSTSLSSSGYVNVLDRRGNLQREYYYIYAYQYIYERDGIIQTETHTFTMTGDFLGNPDDWILNKRVRDNHVAYTRGESILLIPWKNANDGIWYSHGIDSISRRIGSTDDWIKLA